MPVVIALTKWDLVSANARRTDDAVHQVLGDLMDAVRETNHLFGALIHVACGRQPLNVALPVLWCLHVGIVVRGMLLQRSIDYHDQLSAMAARQQGLWDDVRSWWRNELPARTVAVLAQQQVQSDLRSLLPLVAPVQKLEGLLESVEKF